MPYNVVGLESSPVAAALAGPLANEARYFKNRYDRLFTVEPATNNTTTIDWVHRIPQEERDIVLPPGPLFPLRVLPTERRRPASFGSVRTRDVEPFVSTGTGAVSAPVAISHPLRRP